MRVAVIGGGLIGMERLNSLVALSKKYDSQNIKITCVVDPDAGRLGKIKEQFGCEVSTRLEDALSTSPDWVFICTPHDSVLDIAKLCLSRDCNVLIEKPLGRTLDECDQILGLVASKSQLTVGFNYRFYPGIHAAVSDALNGEFGELISVNMVLGHGNSPGMEKSWKLDPIKCGGGALIDPGVHLLDLALLLAKGDDLDVVGGKTWSGIWNTGIEEEIHVVLKSRSETIFNIQASLNRWRSTFRLEINGTKGYAVVDGRGRSYGPQTYSKGQKWGWQSGKSQSESEVVVVDSDPANDSFTDETADILGLNSEGLDGSSKINACTAHEGRHVMHLLDQIRTQLGMDIIKT